MSAKQPSSRTSPLVSNARGKHSSPPRFQKPQNLQRPFLDWLLRNQITVSSTIILSIASTHLLIPQLRPHTRKVFQLSYPYSTSEGTVYRPGKDDIQFVLAWVIYFTALRAIIIEWLLRPIAKALRVEQKNQLRFAEQGWLVLYDGTFWTLGMYLWYNSVYWLNNSEIWTAWPAAEMSGTLKWYYLVQLSFWIQQILVIHVEARRKDHAQMLFHHFVTCTLISVTYVYRYTRAANVVLCLMDLVDVLLPLAKMLRYLGYKTACNIAFGVFVVTWLVTRHILFLKLCWDIYVDAPGPKTLLYGCYNGVTNERLDMPSQPDYFSHLLWPFQDINGTICVNSKVKFIFLGMLLLLHTLCLFWFAMIMKIVVSILMGQDADDTRSDNDSEEEGKVEKTSFDDLSICAGGGAELESSMVKLAPVEDLEMRGRGNGNSESSTMTSQPKRRPTTMRRKIMDAGNRKELLARIGCEKLS